MRPRLTAAAGLLLATIPAAISVEELDSQRRWWRAVEIQRHLRLTAAQVARLDALFERELPQRIEQHRQIQDLDGHLAHVIEHDNGDDSYVAQLTERGEALRAAQNIRRTLMLFAMYQTLTLEQRTLLAHMHRSGSGSPRRELGGPVRFPLARRFPQRNRVPLRSFPEAEIPAHGDTTSSARGLW